MKVIVLHEAEVEFWESVDYYEMQEPGLGVRFEEEVDRFITKITADPLRPRLRQMGYRRVNLLMFRHYIAYITRGDIVWILAICHGHQRPEFWIKRLGNV